MSEGRRVVASSIALRKFFFLWKAMEMRLHNTCNFIVKINCYYSFPPFCSFGFRAMTIIFHIAMFYVHTTLLGISQLLSDTDVQKWLVTRSKNLVLFIGRSTALLDFKWATVSIWTLYKYFVQNNRKCGKFEYLYQIFGYFQPISTIKRCF